MNHWIKELLINLDDHVDDISKQKILEKCGPHCPFSHLPNEKILELRHQSKNEEDFLDKLIDVWHLKKENNQHYVVFDQCYCPLVNNDIQNSSKTMCYCTLGNLKHKFKISLGREVEVQILKTVLNGDDECRFKIGISPEPEGGSNRVPKRDGD
ncbi:hypothetical protein EXM22_09290 [Oceanispirochaeta crateris]|uniref:Metanogen output domain-containing protein n=1 Tax=Oceanispirochaeta crateris TaxID=2518645 RepID=A0A5C1QMI0_9SPIO|nr:DUF6144 family protein [Oceanispirochaeta crateris]QEN08170.1 hypothetical protein EXM22_09290 [Oceanispirochaeta crateris]